MNKIFYRCKLLICLNIESFKIKNATNITKAISEVPETNVETTVKLLKDTSEKITIANSQNERSETHHRKNKNHPYQLFDNFRS